ncbi:hypothetical protein GYB22_06965 [bacterium]|nr:hypothetical protein [bacterium]
MKANTKWLLLLTIPFVLLLGCETENFDTNLDITLSAGLNSPLMTPCPVVIKRLSYDHSRVTGSSVIDTVYTDSFGRYSWWLKLPNPGNPAKGVYYQAQILESKWELPIAGARTEEIIAGIDNSIFFRVIPKWRHDIVVKDSSGDFEFREISIYNTETLNYYQTETIESFSPNSSKLIIASAPSHSHLFVTVRGISRSTGEYVFIEKIYDSDKNKNIWINL